MTTILLDAQSPEAGGVLRTVEASRAGDAHSCDVIVSLFGRLTGVRGVANLARRTNALETADDVDAVGTTSARVALQTFVDVLAAEIRVTVKSNRTDALHTGGTLQTDCSTATGNVFTARNSRTRTVWVAARATIADALVGC